MRCTDQAAQLISLHDSASQLLAETLCRTHSGNPGEGRDGELGSTQDLVSHLLAGDFVEDIHRYLNRG